MRGHRVLHSAPVPFASELSKKLVEFHGQKPRNLKVDPFQDALKGIIDKNAKKGNRFTTQTTTTLTITILMCSRTPSRVDSSHGWAISCPLLAMKSAIKIFSVENSAPLFRPLPRTLI